MRHKVHTFKIGRTGSHRRAMLSNMVCSLIEHGEIKTTLTKAKEARRLADKMITYGKKGTLHHRRLAVSKLQDKDCVKILFDELSPKYSDRNGGYTRIIKLDGNRRGDAAEMCLLQWVEEELAGSPSKKSKKQSSKKKKKTEEKAVEEKKEEPSKVEKPETEKTEKAEATEADKPEKKTEKAAEEEKMEKDTEKEK